MAEKYTDLARNLRPLILRLAEQSAEVVIDQNAVSKTVPGVITAVHQFNPALIGAPFTLGTSAQGQTVPGLRADQLNKSVLSGMGLIGGGMLDADRTLSINQAANLTWTGAHTFRGLTKTRHVLPELTDAYDLGSFQAMFRKIYASEISAIIFAKYEKALIGGWLCISKNEGAFDAAVGAMDAAINFGQTMTPNDYIEVRGNLQVEYMRVGTLVSGTTYNVSRNLDGTGANGWPAGQVYQVLGQNGNGWIELNAYDTPRISIFRHLGTAYNSREELVRIGDLAAWDGNATEHYGIGIGDFAGGNYLRYDQNNFEVKGGDGNINIDRLGIGIQYHAIRTPKAEITFIADTPVISTLHFPRIASDYVNTAYVKQSRFRMEMDTVDSMAASFTLSGVYDSVSQKEAAKAIIYGQSASIEVGNGTVNFLSKRIPSWVSADVSKPGTYDVTLERLPSGLFAMTNRAYPRAFWTGAPTVKASVTVLRDLLNGHDIYFGGTIQYSLHNQGIRKAFPVGVYNGSQNSQYGNPLHVYNRLDNVIGIWVKLTDSNTATPRGIYSYGNGTAYLSECLFARETDRVVTLRWNDGTNVLQLASTYVLPVNQWVFISVMTIYSGGVLRFRLKVNDTYNQEFTMTASPPRAAVAGSYFTIGQGDSYYWLGAIGEVFVSASDAGYHEEFFEATRRNYGL